MNNSNFTQEQMMLLAALAMFDPPSKAPAYDSLAYQPDTSLAATLEDPIIQQSLIAKFGKARYDDLLEHAKKNAFVICLAINDMDGTGFAAIAIADPKTRTVTVVPRATEGFSLDYDSEKDVIEDLMLATQEETPQQKQIRLFMEKLKSFDNIYLVGHSLGGNLAIYGALSFSDLDKIRAVITFNSPGFNEIVFRKYEKEISRLRDRIVNYQNEDDYVSDVMLPIGSIVLCKASGKDSHGLAGFLIDKNGQIQSLPPGATKSFFHEHLQYSTIALVTVPGSAELLTVLIVYLYAQCKVSPAFNLVELLGRFFNSHPAHGLWGVATAPQIRVNTNLMREYAARLDKVNKRLAQLDKDLDGFYRKVSIGDAIHLALSDLKIDSRSRLSACADYLRKTADSFEKAEKRIIEQIFSKE